MPFLTIPVALAISAGATAGTSIYAANKAGSANDKSIAAQTAANDKALDFEKGKYADLNARLTPYRQAGAGATTRMSDLLHVPSQPAPAAWNPSQPSPGSGPGYPVTGFSGPVTLRAPNGTTKVFTDPALIAHYQQQGAQVVQ